MPATPACDRLRQDHREMELHLDRLMACLERLHAGQIPEVQAAFGTIQRLSAIHFEKEEKIFYPAVRPSYPDLLAHMDEQHDTARELEDCVAVLLSDVPAAPDSRWLNDLRSLGIEFHDRIQHHIVDEEEQLFRIAAGCLRVEDQVRLAAEMDAISHAKRIP